MMKMVNMKTKNKKASSVGMDTTKTGRTSDARININNSNSNSKSDGDGNNNKNSNVEGQIRVVVVSTTPSTNQDTSRGDEEAPNITTTTASTVRGIHCKNSHGVLDDNTNVNNIVNNDNDNDYGGGGGGDCVNATISVNINDNENDNDLDTSDGDGNGNGNGNSNENDYSDNENDINNNNVFDEDDVINNNVVDNDDLSNDKKEKFPSDTYSFLCLYGPFHNFYFFSFGMLPFVFQSIFYSLMILHLLGGNLDVDNPDSDVGFIASFIPANISPLVKATQVVALLAYVIFTDSSLQDVATAVNLYPTLSKTTRGDRTRQLVFSAILRGTQGILATIAVCLLVNTSNSALDMILNFTAVGYISQLDNIAFALAKRGRFGPVIEAETKEIEKLPLPRCIIRENKHVRYLCTVVITGIILIGITSSVLALQSDDNVWTTRTVRVQFKETTGLQDYNGCYKINEGKFEGRHTYKSNNDIIGEVSSEGGYDYSSLREKATVENNAAIGYCKDDRAWILYDDTATNSTPCSTTGGIIRSTETDTFDISTSYDAGWFSFSGTPMDLYFFEVDDDVDLNCGLYMNDGICDVSFNDLDYQYDGGDCCVATCTHPICGLGGINGVFGNTNATGDGFPNCVDPSMVPITIRFDSIYGNHNDVFTDRSAVDFLEEFDSIYYTPERIDGILDDHLEKEPKNPILLLDCNEQNVMTMYVDESMENKSETVMVEDGAICTMTIQNSTGVSDFLCDKVPVLYVNYTIFHGDETSINHSPIVIATEQTSAQDTINFEVVPTCYLNKLNDYFDNTTLYTGSTPANEAIDWLMDDKSRNSACENPFFIERYALGVMSFTAPFTFDLLLPPAHSPTISPTLSQAPSSTGQPTDQPSFIIEKILNDMVNMTTVAVLTAPSSVPDLTTTMPWISSQEQCLWESILCVEGSVKSLTLYPIAGSIASEIGLLSNLESITLEKNELTGTLPSEFFSLTKLTSALIYMNQLTGTISSEIGLLSNLEGKFQIKGNKFTGTIPTEIGLLTSIDNFDLDWNSFTGVIPSEIGGLTGLTRLSIGFNKLSGSLPREIGLLTSLHELKLHYNDLMTGSIPSEVGSMTSLKRILLMNSKLTGSIPTEIGLLTSLYNLWLNDNYFSGNFPSNVLNITQFESISVFNTSIDLESIPRSFSSVIVEPCVFCDGGSFDYIESVDENEISLADECLESIKDVHSSGRRVPWMMKTIDACNLQTEKCVVCRQDQNTSVDDNSNQTSSSNSNKVL